MVKSSDCAWIVVSDIKKARKFFTETVGLKELSYSEEHNWLELAGTDGGAQLGICQENDQMKAGTNAVVTFTVENLDNEIERFKKKGVAMMGEVMIVPNHVKMQFFKDIDGNVFQLVELLGKHF